MKKLHNNEMEANKWYNPNPSIFSPSTQEEAEDHRHLTKK